MHDLLGEITGLLWEVREAESQADAGMRGSKLRRGGVRERECWWKRGE